MRTYSVVFTREASDQLAAIYRFIAEASGYPNVAADYTEAIVEFCETLEEFPRRYLQRDDIRPGLRITNYRKRTVIAYSVDDDRVSIIGIFHSGQEYEGLLGGEALD